MASNKRRLAASKGWETRKKNQRRAARASKQRASKRATEQRKIERLLGEDFDSLAEARAALKEETKPTDVQDADRWDDVYDDFPEFDDGGEFNSGVET